MSRIRTIKPEFFLDSKIAKKPALIRLFFIGLWCHADREGRLEEDQDRLRLQILPYDKFDIEQFLSDLHPEFLIRYKIGSRGYLQILNFIKHQRPHPKEAATEILPPSSRRAVILNGKKCNYIASKLGRSLFKESQEGVSLMGRGGGNPSKQFIEPTIDEISTYAKTIDYDLDAKKFLSHYQANGWMRGKNKVKDWKACVNYWKSNESGGKSNAGEARPKPGKYAGVGISDISESGGVGETKADA